MSSTFPFVGAITGIPTGFVPAGVVVGRGIVVVGGGVVVVGGGVVVVCALTAPILPNNPIIDRVKTIREMYLILLV